MIQKMTKITLLFLSPIKNKILKELQELGIVHLETEQTDVSQEIISLESELNRLVRAGQVLKNLTAESDTADFRQPYNGTVMELTKVVERTTAALDKAKGQIKLKTTELESVQLHGYLSADFRKAMEESGYYIDSYIADKKDAEAMAEEMEGGKDPEKAIQFVELFEDKGKTGFLIIYPLGNRPAVDASRLHLSEKSSSELNAELEDINNSVKSLRESINALVKSRGFLERETAERRNHLALLLADKGTVEAVDGEVTVLKGWIPSEDSEKLELYLSNQEIVYYLEKPSFEDPAPIKLKNSRYTRLFEPIMRIFSLPNYQELDPTPYFAPFYMLFFGLCVADMGFGLLMFVSVLAALLFIKKKSLKPLLYLAAILSLSVMVGGLFLDDFFGLHLTELMPKGSFFQKIILFKTQNDAMLLAIMLGFIQVTLGYVLRIIIQVRKHGPAGAGKPLGVIFIILGTILIALNAEGPSFAIGPFALGIVAASLPSPHLIGLGLITFGVVLILFLGSLKHKIYIRPFVGLWELYELATGLPGDILSYLRLFALGLAGGLLSFAVNQIALSVRGDSLLGIIPFVLILIIGSALNLGIGLLSAFVHSLRLTFVEFYKAVGFKGGGIEYSPFQIK